MKNFWIGAKLHFHYNYRIWMMLLFYLFILFIKYPFNSFFFIISGIAGWLPRQMWETRKVQKKSSRIPGNKMARNMDEKRLANFLLKDLIYFFKFYFSLVVWGEVKRICSMIRKTIKVYISKRFNEKRAWV